jgi:DNA helicase II / ATP-dependent DNA helicase PcrA
MKPTKEQQKVINHQEGKAVVFAVAGSGKTTTVVKRINRLIRDCGHMPQRILATTFSKYAKKQLESKLQAEDHCAGVEVATLHSVAHRVISFRTEQLDVPRRIEIDDDGLMKCFYQAKDRIREGLGINLKQAPVDRQVIEELGYKDFSNYLMQLKGDMLATEWMHDNLPERAKPYFDVESFSQNTSLEVLIDTYEEQRKQSRLMGFDDLMVGATIHLGSDLILREQFSAKFEFILVDEYQDVNKAQNMMLQFLDERAGNMMVVGDDDQTIYEWRGARPDFIRQKLSDNSWRTYKLSRNFRSSPGPVILASQVIEKNQNRAPKKMMPMMPFTGRLDIRRFHSIREQSEEISSIIKSVYLEAGSYDNIVILIRQYAETPCIEQSLIANEIPYEIPDSQPFYFRRETQFILEYLSFISLEYKRRAGPLSTDDQEQYAKALAGIYVRPKTYIKRTDMLGLVEKALKSSYRELSISDLLDDYNTEIEKTRGRRSEPVDNLIDYLSLFSGQDPRSILAKDAIGKLDEKTGLRKWIIDTAVHPKVGVVRSQIFEALIDYSESDSLHDFLAQINLVKSLNATEIRGSSTSRVKLLTVFKAKGLEFPVVIVPNMNSAQMDVPATASKETFSNGSQEEERRIFYVAMTRAIHDLHIFYTSNEPSTYLTEASYKDVERYVAECAAVFRGNLALLAEDDGCYFLEKLLAHMYRYQVGNACARSWARVLDQGTQKDVYEHLLSRIEEYMLRESSQATEKKREVWSKLRDFLENINMNACSFRDSAVLASVNEEERERFGVGSGGDRDLFDVIIHEDQEDFE